MYRKLLNVLIAASMVLSANVYAKDYSDYAQKFYDVDKSHWAFEYIAELADKNIISGYEDGSFKPNNTVSRAEWAKLICDISGMQKKTYDEPYAVDYSSSDWFCGYVNAVANYMNFYEADGELYFRGNQAISREDVTVSLVKMKGIDVDNADYSYVSAFEDDNSISNSAKKYVAVAVEKGLISGYEDNTFRGQDTLTRAEAATLLSKAEKIGNDNKVIIDNTEKNTSSEKKDEQVKNNSEDCYPNTIIPSYGKVTGKSVLEADVREGLVIYMYDCRTNDDPQSYMEELAAQGWSSDGGTAYEDKNLIIITFEKNGVELGMSIYFDEYKVLIYFEGTESNLENKNTKNNSQSSNTKNDTVAENNNKTEKKENNKIEKKEETKITEEDTQKEETKVPEENTQKQEKSNKEYVLQKIFETDILQYSGNRYVIAQVDDNVYFVPKSGECIQKFNIISGKTEEYQTLEEHTFDIDDEEYEISKIISLFYDESRGALCATCTVERNNPLSGEKDTANILINAENMKFITRLDKKLFDGEGWTNIAGNYYCFTADSDKNLYVYFAPYKNSSSMKFKISDRVAVLDAPEYVYGEHFNVYKKTMEFEGGKSYVLEDDYSNYDIFDVKNINSEMYIFTDYGIYKPNGNKFKTYVWGSYRVFDYYGVGQVVQGNKASFGADKNGFYVINDENIVWTDLNGKVKKSCALKNVDCSECKKDGFPDDKLRKLFVASNGDIVIYSFTDGAFMKLEKV